MLLILLEFYEKSSYQKMPIPFPAPQTPPPWLDLVWGWGCSLLQPLYLSMFLAGGCLDPAANLALIACWDDEDRGVSLPL